MGVRRARSRIATPTILRVQPPSGDYGPTYGAQSVRDGAGPQTVSDPGGGITFTTRADLSTKIGANPAGTTFVHAAGGTENFSAGLSIPAGKAPKIYFLGLAGSTATVLTGGTGSAIGLDFPANGGGEVHGGTWQSFGSLTSETWMTAINGRGPFLAEDCVFDACYRGVGYDSTGAAVSDIVRYNRLYAFDSLRYGFTISGSFFVFSVGPEVSYCRWTNSNTGQFATDNDAGGSKFLCRSLHVHHCWVDGNYGSGIWMDYSFDQPLIEENVVENNRNWGIFYEVGTGGSGFKAEATIRYNAVLNNCTSGTFDWFNNVQILSSCSDGALNAGTGYEIHNNLIDSTTERLALGFIDHESHAFNVKNFYAHDNDIWLRGTGGGRVGGEKSAGETFDPFDPSANNRFENNHYHVTDTGLAKWRWAGANQTWAQWQALGHDDTGTLELI